MIRGRSIVLGATSLIAGYLMPRLVERGFTVTAAARRGVGVPPGVSVADIAALPAIEGAAIVSLLPLQVCVDMLPRLQGVARIVAVGSTSVFSKAESDDAVERIKAASLAAAEATFFAWCKDRGVAGTVLRPTLVYDREGDRNIARMVRFIRRFRLLPLAAPANGLRQPIHADDVAKAIVAALDCDNAAGLALDIGGAEALTYRAMAERLFDGLRLRRRCLMLPTGLLRRAFAAGARLGLLREKAFGGSVFDRMNQDLVYDFREGLRLLGYDPRPFRPFDPPRPGDRDCTSLRSMNLPGSSKPLHPEPPR